MHLFNKQQHVLEFLALLGDRLIKMKEAIAKLMIATMMVDFEQTEKEHDMVKTVLGVLDINDEEYSELLQQTQDFITQSNGLINKDDTFWISFQIY